MEVKILKFGGGDAGTMTVPDSFAARKFNAALAHQAVCANFANAREGNRAQKTRAEVSHTTRKLFRQKGSGRARAGMSSSPIRRGGGRAFPSRPDENFRRKMPRKMYRAAMAVLFSELLRAGRVAVVKSLAMDAPKTREIVKQVSGTGVAGQVVQCRQTGKPEGEIRPGIVLLVDTEMDDNILLSARNVPYLRHCPLHSLLPADLTAEALVITERAMSACAEKWS